MIRTYRALRNEDIAIQRDIVSETVHGTVTLNLISFQHNEDLVISVLLANDLGPLCAKIGWSC